MIFLDDSSSSDEDEETSPGFSRAVGAAVGAAVCGSITDDSDEEQLEVFGAAAAQKGVSVPVPVTVAPASARATAAAPTKSLIDLMGAAVDRVTTDTYPYSSTATAATPIAASTSSSPAPTAAAQAQADAQAQDGFGFTAAELTSLRSSANNASAEAAQPDMFGIAYKPFRKHTAVEYTLHTQAQALDEDGTSCVSCHVTSCHVMSCHVRVILLSALCCAVCVLYASCPNPPSSPLPL